MTARIISGLRSLFPGSETETQSLVASCANDIRCIRGLEQWIESIAVLNHSERTGMLLRASGTLTNEFMATDLSNTLSCMAADAGLFLAVAEALKKSNQKPVQFAQAA